jgi:hypothetical protein
MKNKKYMLSTVYHRNGYLETLSDNASIQALQLAVKHLPASTNR